jgi:DNA-binding response OmpR family regulator
VSAKILIVDDEANIRSSLSEMLAQDGYQVWAVASGEEALERMMRQVFDLVLLDLKLQGIGGIDVLAAIRQQFPDTIVIVLTAHASLETAVEALRQGAHDYLFKPCKPAELRESISRGLRNRQQLRHVELLEQIEKLANNLESMRSTVAEWQDQSEFVEPTPPISQDRFIKRGQLIVDRLRHLITLDGHLLDLSPTEFDILAYLIQEAPRVVSATELVQEVQGYDVESWEASETVRQHIYRIRQKTKEMIGEDAVIDTVRGVGYTIYE